MSKERELLKKLRYATHLEDDLRKELEELLAQSKQEPKQSGQNTLSDEERQELANEHRLKNMRGV